MSDTFSTRCVRVIPCPEPVLTIGFPTKCAPSPENVVLANGACVNVVELGQIIGQFCPGFAPTTVTTQADLSPEAFQQVQVQLQTLGVDAAQAFAAAQAGVGVAGVAGRSVAVPQVGSQVVFGGATRGGCGCSR